VSNRSDEIFRIVKETDVPSDERDSTYVQVSTTVHAHCQEGSKATNHVGMQPMYICICMYMCPTPVDVGLEVKSFEERRSR